MNKINNRFNENENDKLILSNSVKDFYAFNKLIKDLFLFRFIIIILAIILTIFFFKFSKINNYINQLDEIINKNMNLITNNFSHSLENIIVDCRKEVILDNKMVEHEYEDNTDFSKYLPNIKALAIYIPTFYYENEKNAFIVETNKVWKNVKEAKPLFTSHYQPRKPIK